MNDDLTLLRDYARNQSEAAFATLVSRYVSLVYSVALRSVRDPHLAEEITQAVFIILAHKADSFGDQTILPGWLCRTARYVSANALTIQRRRRHREQEAYMESTLNESEPAHAETWQQIAPLLDGAMEQLGQKDHDALVLRYFEGRNFAEVGAALGASEDAAKMRVSRALEKLRKLFTKRGVSSTTAILAGTISANSVQAAPIALAKSVTAVAIAKGATASISTLTLIKGALKIMAWAKAKSTIVTGVIILLAAGTTTIAVKEIEEHRTYPWQIANPNPDGVKMLNSTPSQVAIIRSRFAAADTSTSILVDDILPKDQWRYIGIYATPSEIIIRAFQNGFPLLSSQIILPANMPEGHYDYIANLKNGSQKALQALIKKKFGLAGSSEIRDSDVLLLKVARPNAAGLKLTAQPEKPQGSGIITRGLIHIKSEPMSRLAKDIGWDLQIPVIDRTELTEKYDFDFPEKLDVTPDEKLEKTKLWLLDQLGLELVPTNMPIEMLVIEKVQ